MVILTMGIFIMIYRQTGNRYIPNIHVYILKVGYAFFPKTL